MEKQTKEIRKHNWKESLEEIYLKEYIEQARTQAISEFIAELKDGLQDLHDSENEFGTDEYRWILRRMDNLSQKYLTQSPQIKSNQSSEVELKTGSKQSNTELRTAESQSSEDANVQKAINEFKEKLKERINVSMAGPQAEPYVTWAYKKKQERDRILEIIEKTAQEIKA